ncbi:hypothetical protein ACTXOU_07580 [Psychrobacter glacincola]
MGKIALLGGSNSIIKNGLRSGIEAGLSSELSLDSFALGATTSSQNLYEVIKNFDSLEHYDYVITESNVNDIHALHTILPLEKVILQINDYYQNLSLLSVPVITLILPTSNKFSKSEEINDCHIYNCHKFGFNYINLCEKFGVYQNDPSIMSDHLHPNVALMKLIGYRLGKELNHNFKDMLPLHDLDIKTSSPRYKYVSPNEFFSQTVSRNKVNSLFNESCYFITKAQQVNPIFNGWEIFGIGTWCDKPAKIKFQNSSSSIIKAFNVNNAFNTFSERLIINDTLVITPKPNSEVNDFSLNVNKKGIFLGDVLFTGFLLKDSSKYGDKLHKRMSVIDLSSILDDIEMVLGVVDEQSTNKALLFKNLVKHGFYMSALELIKYDNSKHFVSECVEIFHKLKTTDKLIAYEFIKQAQLLNPENLSINNKVQEVLTKINIK